MWLGCRNDDQEWLAKGWSQKEINQWKEEKRKKHKKKRERKKERQWAKWERVHMQKADTLQPLVVVEKSSPDAGSNSETEATSEDSKETE